MCPSSDLSFDASDIEDPSDSAAGSRVNDRTVTRELPQPLTRRAPWHRSSTGPVISARSQGGPRGSGTHAFVLSATLLVFGSLSDYLGRRRLMLPGLIAGAVGGALFLIAHAVGLLYPRHTAAMIRAVVFDLDGVLLDSERVWDDARRQVVDEHRGQWRVGATAEMQGMSSVEWSAYLHDELGADLDRARIIELVVDLVLDSYRRALPLVPGARDAVVRIGKRWPLGLASSANRRVIDEVLGLGGLAAAFRVTVSSEEVGRGKPHPDVYLEAAHRLGEPPRACVAVEDSANGIRAALAAGLFVAAVPNREFPPAAEVLARADLVVARLSDLTVGALGRLGPDPDPSVADAIDEQEVESFPASDAHSDWAGPGASSGNRPGGLT